MYLPLCLALVALSNDEKPIFTYQADRFTISGKDVNVGVLLDQIAEKVPGKLIFFEPAPSASKVSIRIKNYTLAETLAFISQRTPLRFSSLPRERGYAVCWSEGDVPKGKVRMYKSNGNLLVAVSAIEATDFTALAKLFFDKGTFILNSTKAPISLTLSDPISEDIFAQKVNERIVKANAEPPAPEKPLVWTLTYLGAEAPALDSAAKIAFNTLPASVNVASIVNSLNNTYKTKNEEKQDVLPITQLGNTLLITGPHKYRIGELLATRIDIPQSQVQVQLTSYIASSNTQSERGNKEVLTKLVTGQEIARAYRKAMIETIYALVDSNREVIKARMENQKLGGNLCAYELYSEAGYDVTKNRRPSFAELLLYLAYLPDKELECLKSKICSTFEAAHKQVCLRIPTETISVPVENNVKGSAQYNSSQTVIKRVSKDLTDLNNQIHFRAKDLLSKSDFVPQLLLTLQASHVDAARVTQPQRAIAEFFLGRYGVAQKSKGNKEQTNKSLIKINNLFGADIEPRTSVSAVQNDYDFEALKEPVMLLRTGLAVDDILAAATNAIEADADTLVDQTFKEWCEEIQKSPTGSDFGVRNLGTTTITATSRSAAIVGSETTSFFPFQPSADADLSQLLGVLKRSDPAPSSPPKSSESTTTTTTTSGVDENGKATSSVKTVKEDKDKTSSSSGGASGDTSIAAKLAAIGLTPIETLGLTNLFDNAKLSPYYKEIGSGVNFSFAPTMMPSGTEAKLQVRVKFAMDPKENAGGAGDKSNKPAPVNVMRSISTETELYARTLDLATITTMQLNISAPSKRDWELPVLSTVLSPLKSWFVGPTMDKTIRHEAVMLLRIKITPKAMDLASRIL